jgi:hypothetical protein
MPTAVDSGRATDSPSVGLRGDPQSEDWERHLTERVLEMVAMNDTSEDIRRKSDRIGANLRYGRHWAIMMPESRSQITANVAGALIEHKVAIMCKQKPTPVIEAGEAGDQAAARLMRQVIMRWWDNDQAQMKLRRTQRLAECTRTTAAKIVWDPTLHEGAGNMTWDIIPGWRLILDDQANFVENMEYIGHRETMPRSRACLFYPDEAERIRQRPRADRRATAAGSDFPSSPIGTPYDRAYGSGINFGQIVNGKPVISAFTNQPAKVSPKTDTVQIIELHYKDYTLYKDTEKSYDPSGNTVLEIEKDEDGMPLFDQIADEILDEAGQTVSIPAFKLRMREREEKVLKRVYPWWRRTTVLLPDGAILDDRAWDGPAPYALDSAGDALEGPWVKGSLLDCEDTQIAFNVSLSSMMDNLRLNAMRPILAGREAQFERNTLMIGPAEVVNVGKVEAIKPLEFPEVKDPWFKWLDKLLQIMERIIGLSGIMQGEAAGRVDSASGYDQLAEIGGSRVSESTQRMEKFIADITRIVGWYAQNRYTDKHAIAVENAEGVITHERVSGPFLYGTFDYKIAVGSTQAWSESARRARLLGDLQAGIIDKIAYWQQSETPDWQAIKERLLTQNPILSGAAGAPPKRTSAKKSKTPQPPVPK